MSEVQRQVTGKFNDRFRAIVEDISIHAAKGTLAEDMNKALMLSVRSTKPIAHDQFDPATNKAIRLAAKGVKDLYADMGVDLKKIGVIDDLVDNYVPRMWNRSAIEKNQKGLTELLQSKGGMTKGDARRTVDSMLDIKNHVDEGGSGGYFFSSKRKLNDIGNDADFQEFLNDDVLGSLYAYTFQAGKSIAKHRVLGVRNFKEFEGFYINRIRKEIEDKGETFSSKQAKQLEMLYRTATGEGLNRYGKTGQDIADVYGFTNRIAMLGLVTVSSLTEVFLNVAKAGVRNSVKGLGEAMEFSFKNVTKDLESKLVTNNKLTAKEAMSEMRQFSIHVDQAMAQLGDRLSGDALVNERLQNASNKFFRLNMLDQWTKFVQATSFSAGKHLINENIEALSKNGSRELTGRMQSRAGELAELGIDYKKAVDWHNAGGKMDDAFYKDDVLGGVARYTNSVILQPSAMSGLKPLLHSHPKTAILFQLMSYPAAFTNTVLKGAAKQLTKDPIRNAGKIVPAALIMTGMARWTNYLRTNGESEKNKDMDEIIGASVARWGGNGILLDSFQRAKTAAKYTQSSLSYAGMPFGPVTSDAINLIQQGIVPVVGNKVPLVSGTYFGKQILGDEEVTHYRKTLRNIQEDTFGGLIPEFDKEVPLPGYAGGGIIKAGVKAITDVATDFTGSILSTLPPKIKSKRPTELEDEIAENISKATDNYFKPEAMEAAASTVSRGLDELEATGHIDAFDLESLEFVDAMVFNEIKRDVKSIEELEKIPSWKKAMESSSEREAIENWAQTQKDMGFDKEHRNALKIIQDSKNKIDPEGEVEFVVPELIRGLKNAYTGVNIKVTPEEIAAAQKQKFDNDTFDFMHDFISMSARERMKILSEVGGDKIAEKVLIKLAAEGNINFPAIKAPKLKDTVEDNYPDVVTGAERKLAINKYVKKSVEKTPFFRTEKSFQQAQSFLAFAFSREVGVHVGSEGAATTIAIRALPNTRSKRDFKLDADSNTLNRQRSGETFASKNLFEPEDNMRMMSNEDVGYFGTIAEEKDFNIIEPITMNSGYIDVRKPLQLDNDLEGWEAERILSYDFEEMFIPAIKKQGGTITQKQQKKLDDLTERSKEFEGLFLDPPVTAKLDIVGFYRQELKRAAINREFREVIESIGFDSIKYKNEVEIGFEGETQFSYILFKPEQFKSVTARAFDPTDSRHGAAKGGYITKRKGYATAGIVRGITGVVAKAFAPKKASGTFSQANKAAQELQGSKPRPGQSFLNELEKKVTPDELKFTGATEKFSNNTPVSKEEVQQFFAENEFDFSVTTGRPKPLMGLIEEDAPVDELSDEFEDTITEAFDDWLLTNRPAERDMMDELVEDDDAFDSLYNELFEEFEKDTGGMGDFATQPMHLDYSFEGQNTQNYREVVISVPTKFKQTKKDYTHKQHHPSLVNQIAHVRLSDVEEAQDAFTRTLLVDEIQSDAHQTAQRVAKETKLDKGYLSRAREKEIMDSGDTDKAAMYAENVPDLPLRKERKWATAGLRQAMRIAAEEGYDQVALTTGRMQAERNRKIGDISEAIFYKQTGKDSTGWSVQGVRNEDEGMGDFLINFDSYEDGVERLPKIIGKENAEKLLTTAPDDLGDYTLKQQMTFNQGGQKFLNFYDKTLIDILQTEFASKYDVQISTLTYKQNDDTVELPTLKITEEMREDILKGLKMFNEGGKVNKSKSTCKTAMALRVNLQKKGA